MDQAQSVRVAAWQGPCLGGEVDANAATVARVIDDAARHGASFLCLPETFLSGYGTHALIRAGATSLDDPRVTALGALAGARGITLLLGLTEQADDGRLFNTVAIFDQGRRIGIYRKTQRTGSDIEMGFAADDDLPVFEAKGLRFGVIVCHDSSFFEPAATLAYRGAEVIFSPHYNAMPFAQMDEHRIHVRNNHVGLAALLGVFVVRANVVGRATLRADDLGYGDSAIFSPIGAPLAEAGLFTERLIVADLDLADTRRMRWKRDKVSAALGQALADAQRDYSGAHNP